MADPTFPLIPLLAFFALLATIAPLGFISPRDHTGTVVFMTWQSTSCIQVMVNRILWHGTTRDIAPIWCDIITKVEIMRTIGIPASELCMMRGIYRVIRMDNHFDTNAKRRLMTLQSVAISVVFPMFVAASWPLIASHRYAIVEDVGCMSWIAAHWVTFAVYRVWPTALSAVTSVYCVLTVRQCEKLKRSRGGNFSNQSEINSYLFSRTFLCARAVLFMLLPTCAYHLVYSLRSGIAPFPGTDAMATYRKDVTVVTGPINNKLWFGVHFTYVNAVARLITSFCFFSIFGTGQVAVRHYSRVFSRIVACLGLTRKKPQRQLAIVGDDIVFAAPAASGTTRNISLMELGAGVPSVEDGAGPSRPSNTDVE